MADSVEQVIVVPEGFKLYTENSAHILLPAGSSSAFSSPVKSSSAKPSPSKQSNNNAKGSSANNANSAKTAQKDHNDEAFLNPVQEFNRDLSVACIRVWSEGVDGRREVRWRAKMEKGVGGKGGKGQGGVKGRKKVKVETEGEGEVEVKGGGELHLFICYVL